MLMGALLDAAVDSFVWASAVAIFLGEALLHDAALHGSWSDATQATKTIGEAEARVRKKGVATVHEGEASRMTGALILDEDDFSRIASAVEQKLRERLGARQGKPSRRQDSFGDLADRVEKLILERSMRAVDGVQGSS